MTVRGVELNFLGHREVVGGFGGGEGESRRLAPPLASITARGGGNDGSWTDHTGGGGDG